MTGSPVGTAARHHRSLRLDGYHYQPAELAGNLTVDVADLSSIPNLRRQA